MNTKLTLKIGKRYVRRVVIECESRANARRLAARVKSDKPYFNITVEKSS